MEACKTNNVEECRALTLNYIHGHEELMSVIGRAFHESEFKDRFSLIILDYLDIGIELNYTNRLGQNCLIIASNHGSIEVAEELLKIKELEINFQDSYG